MWFKIAKNTDAKYRVSIKSVCTLHNKFVQSAHGLYGHPVYRKFLMYYIRKIIAQISQKKQRKTNRKFPIYYIKQIIAQTSQKTQRKA